MKKVLISALLLASFSTIAQEIPVKSDPTPSTSTESKQYRLENTLAKIFGTMTTFEIEQKVYQMNQDGVKERSFSTFFNSEGQLVEINDGDVDCGAYGDEVYGTDIIPYTIKISDDGRIYLDVGVFKIFEMYEMNKIQNSVSFITFEYNKNFDYSKNSELTLNLVKGAMSRGLEFENSELGYGLNGAVSVPLYARFNSPYEPLDLKGGLGIKVGGNISGATYLNKKQDLKVGVGAEGSIRLNRHFNYMSDATRARMDQGHVQALENYNSSMHAQGQWDQDKFDWEVANGYGSSMSTEHYMAVSGAGVRPTVPVTKYGPGEDSYQQKVKRATILLTPSVSLTKEFKNAKGNVKSSLKIELSANLFLRDQFKGEVFRGINSDWQTHLTQEEIVDVNMLNNGMSRNTYSLRLIYKFGNRRN